MVGGDIVDRLQRKELGLRGVEFHQRDFLTSPILKNIISVASNPPYSELQRFCERCVRDREPSRRNLHPVGADRRGRGLAHAAAIGPHLCVLAATFGPYR